MTDVTFQLGNVVTGNEYEALASHLADLARYWHALSGVKKLNASNAAYHSTELWRLFEQYPSLAPFVEDVLDRHERTRKAISTLLEEKVGNNDTIHGAICVAFAASQKDKPLFNDTPPRAFSRFVGSKLRRALATYKKEANKKEGEEPPIRRRRRSPSNE